jgi:putative DNA primase/helicase
MRATPEQPLTDEDGQRLFDLANAFRWRNPGSGAMLAGWCALAPVAGALRWRPHLWITGGTGSGKSTVMKRFVVPLLNNCRYYSGTSTEPGIRQDLQCDALPVLIEEAEKHSTRDVTRVQSILAMMRDSSTETGAKTLKGTASGTAMTYEIRSMFCVNAVGVGLDRQADLERVSVLELKPKRDSERTGEEAARQWTALDRDLARLEKDRALARRLMKRTLDLLPITLENIETFATAAAMKFGSQREGDQYGTLLAGAWSLISQNRASIEDARAMLDQYAWDDHRENAETEESEKVLDALLNAIIIERGQARSVRQWIEIAVGFDNIEACDITQVAVRALLRARGLYLEGDGVGDGVLYVSRSNSAVQGLLESSGYSCDYGRALKRLPGAAAESKNRRFGSHATKCVSVPLRLLFPVPTLSEDRPF